MYKDIYKIVPNRFGRSSAAPSTARANLLALILIIVLCLAGCTKNAATPAPSVTEPPVATSAPSTETPITPEPTAPLGCEMVAGEYPDDWTGGSDGVVELAEFNREIAARNSAYQAETGLGWNNGTITVKPFVSDASLSTKGAWGVYVQKGGEVFHWNTDNTNFWVAEDEGTMSVPMAQWLWSVMAESDKATKMDEVEALSPQVRELLFFLKWPVETPNMPNTSEPTPPQTTTPTPPTTPGQTSSTMQMEDYPNWGDWVSETEFDEAITGSNWLRLSDYQWTNGSLLVKVVHARTHETGTEVYGLQMLEIGRPLVDGPGALSQWSTYNPMTMDKEGRMSRILAECLWDFMAYCNDKSTDDDIKTFVDSWLEKHKYGT